MIKKVWEYNLPFFDGAGKISLYKATGKDLKLESKYTIKAEEGTTLFESNSMKELKMNIENYYNEIHSDLSEELSEISSQMGELESITKNLKKMSLDKIAINNQNLQSKTEVGK